MSPALLNSALVTRMASALRDLSDFQLRELRNRTAAYVTAGLNAELLNMRELERARLDRAALENETLRRGVSHDNANS